MNTARERIDLTAVSRVYGELKSVAVRELFYESKPGNDYTGPEGWLLLHSPTSLDRAADEIATRYGLVVLTGDGRTLYPEYLRDELIKPRFNPEKPRTYVRGRMMLRFLDDCDTPLIVEFRHGPGDVSTGTYNCVVAEDSVDDHPISAKAVEWLQSFEDEAEAWYEKKRRTDGDES